MIKPLVGKVLAIHPVFGHLSLPLYRNGYALIVSSVATSALGLVYWVLAARFYSTETVGLNSAILSAMLFLSVVAQLNLGGMLVRFVPLAGRATPGLIRFSYIASAVAAVVTCVIFLGGLDVWSPSLRAIKQDGLLLGTFVISTVMWGIFSLQDSALTALRQAVWVPVENALFGALKIVFLLGFAGALTQYGIFASWIIPVALSLLPINLLLFRRFVPAHVRATADRAAPVSARGLFKFISGNYVGAIFFQATMTLLPIIVIGRLGATMNAYFYLPWMITNSLQMIALNMSTSFTVEAAHDTSQIHTHGTRVLFHNLRMLVPLVLIVLIGAPYILGVFGANYASEGSMLLRLLALSTIPYSFVSLYVGVERVRNRVNRIAVMQAARCIVLLAFCYFLLPQFGIVVVGAVWLVTETLVGGFLYLSQLRPFLQKQNRSSIATGQPTS